jgi:hypothetical protein
MPAYSGPDHRAGGRGRVPSPARLAVLVVVSGAPGGVLSVMSLSLLGLWYI